eukprot:TRINITY_DN106035_c0_g1_i1.p1 TRINITY_DN106035_c0_g1~~TRINITY_DN106035_c0_g1_i1.p1  ORF type:complete len:763 (+),score=187.25 TRINITY_DN106035_c0_g1_i1:32-2320(+)
MVHYEVVSCAELGGALVREGKSLASKQIARLAIGAIVSEEERAGERLRFKKISGPGPEHGWVSAKLLSQCDPKNVLTAKPFEGTSLLVQCEAKITERGPSAALQEAGQDGAGRLLASLAYLAEGRSKEASEAAATAQQNLQGQQDGEASATLALALAKLAGREAKEALGPAVSALAKFKEIGDKQMEASTLTTIANVRLAMSEINVAEAAVKDALAIFRQIGDVPGEEAAELTLRDILIAKQGREQGLKSAAKARAEYCKSKNDLLGEGQALQELAQQILAGPGMVAHEEAGQISREALQLFRQAGDRKSELSALHVTLAAELGSDVFFSQAEEALKVSRMIGDEAGEVDLLFTISSALLAGNPAKALQRAEDAEALASKLNDRCGEARAMHAAAAAMAALGQSEDALQKARAAATIFSNASDARGQAAALQTAASVAKTSEAAELLTQAAGLFATVDDQSAEALAKLQLANMLLAAEGSLSETFQRRQLAGRAAEHARVIFLMTGEKKNQGRASHAAAQSKILLGDIDGGVEAAMQAVVLARSCKDKWLEACGLRTAMGGLVCNGHHAEALRMAKEVKLLFQKLGSKSIEEAVSAVISQLEEALPRITPTSRMTVAPRDVSMDLKSSSAFTQPSNCIVWSLPVAQQAYLVYCLELLKFAEDLKSIPDRIQFVVLTRGVMARHLGEPVPSQYEGVIASTVWAICRTIRLEAPKLLMCTVDMPSSCTVHEMSEVVRAACVNPGPRNETAFVVDRKNQLGLRPY